MLDCSLVTGLAAMARTLLLVLAAQDAARGFTLTPKPADLGARTKLPLAVNPLFKTVTVILAVLLRCASPDPLLVLSIKLRAMLAHGPPASLSSLSLSLSLSQPEALRLPPRLVFRREPVNQVKGRSRSPDSQKIVGDPERISPNFWFTIRLSLKLFNERNLLSL